jgi:hypothetical protein
MAHTALTLAVIHLHNVTAVQEPLVQVTTVTTVERHRSIFFQLGASICPTPEKYCWRIPA